MKRPGGMGGGLEGRGPQAGDQGLEAGGDGPVGGTAPSRSPPLLVARDAAPRTGAFLKKDARSRRGAQECVEAQSVAENDASSA